MDLPSPANSWGVYCANVISRSTRRTGASAVQAGRKGRGRPAAPFSKHCQLHHSTHFTAFPFRASQNQLVLETQSLPFSQPLAWHSGLSPAASSQGPPRLICCLLPTLGPSPPSSSAAHALLTSSLNLAEGPGGCNGRTVVLSQQFSRNDIFQHFLR